MELDEMKSLWGNMSKKLQEQELLNDKIILEMTELKYQNKINKLFNLELIPTVINTIVAFFILINFYKLDTISLKISGGILIILFLSSFISLWKIQQMKNLNINNNIEEALNSYVDLRKQLFLIQKSSFPLGFLGMILFLPVYTKIIYNQVFEMSFISWSYFATFTIIILIIIGFIVFKSYRKLTHSAEDILRQLEE